MHAGEVVDSAIIAFLLLQTYLGWRRGLLWQVAGVASIIFGVLLGWALAPSLGGVVNTHITSDPFRARLVAFVFVVASVGFTFRMAGAWAEVRSERGLARPERELRRAEDRILGGIFGALKGCVLALLMAAAAAVWRPESAAWPGSRLADPLARAGAQLLPEGAVQDVAQWANRSAADMRKGLEVK